MRNTKCVSKRFALDESQVPSPPRHSCPLPQCFKNLAEEWNANVDLDESTSSLIHNKLCSVKISVSTAPMKAFCNHRAKQQPTCRRVTLQLSIPTFIYFIWVLPEAQQSVFTGWFCCKIRWNCRGKLQEPVSDQLPLHHAGSRVHLLFLGSVLILYGAGSPWFWSVSC